MRHGSEEQRKRKRTQSADLGSGQESSDSSYDDDEQQQQQQPIAGSGTTPLPHAILTAKPAGPSSARSLEVTPDGSEYFAPETDAEGEKKCSMFGQLTGERKFKLKTFTLPERGGKQFAMATEASRVLGYRDSYLLFNKNKALLKIIVTQEEKEYLIAHSFIPHAFRSRPIAILTAKSLFRQFGAGVIVHGRRVVDDYWEDRARKAGLEDTATRPMTSRGTALARIDRVASVDSPAALGAPAAPYVSGDRTTPRNVMLGALRLALSFNKGLTQDRRVRKTLWRDYWMKDTKDAKKESEEDRKGFAWEARV